MKSYLRKYELMAYLGVKKTTLSRWIEYYKEFIPSSLQGDVVCYGHEAKEVLIRIKMLREQLYSKPHIYEILLSEGYPRYGVDGQILTT
ncbi:MerR family transcriptional regulator [Paenibacillus sp. CGMCC 1.16610]|uniref:MerR family transcriptional regulator n=1 Tax=Paenibacillus anseongense TaxID=2682845 RepID=A0ABW9UGW4_9BACL|nr:MULTISPECIES: MerR family transcriptional regulator [Paenibacillus]MBA2939764.1 MerR family transcriptional regulator [Paenibacillus sp. CGMCC 1.16610]MVQ39424.1 MerR family transcriptional regulator [Paenibacillus anseongense]